MCCRLRPTSTSATLTLYSESARLLSSGPTSAYLENDLIDNVLDEGTSLSDARVAQEALPNLLGHGNVPIYNCLRGAGLLASDGSLGRALNYRRGW